MLDPANGFLAPIAEILLLIGVTIRFVVDILEHRP